MTSTRSMVMINKTSTGPPKTFSLYVKIMREADVHIRKGGGRERPSPLESKTIGVPWHEVITCFLIFGLFLSSGWKALFALVFMA